MQYKILPSISETDLDLEDSVLVWSCCDVGEDVVKEDDPLGSWIVFSLGLAVKLRRRSERRLYLEAVLVVVIDGTVGEIDVPAPGADCNPKWDVLIALSATSCEGDWGELWIINKLRFYRIILFWPIVQKSQNKPRFQK